MRLYSVTFPSRNKFEGTDTFTYSSSLDLNLGDLVSCPFGKKDLNGIITTLDPPKPKFQVKPISRLIKKKLITEVNIDLFNWIRGYYKSDAGTTMELFCTQNLISRIVSSIDQKHLQKEDLSQVQKTAKLNSLDTLQKKALQKIQGKESGSFVLHGPTGSGKTEVYLHTAKKALGKKKSVIVLIPEIGLTTQNIHRFEELGSPLFTLHSKQTPVARARTWQQIDSKTKAGEAVIVLGPRSALFSPVHNLGLIIVDEFHDESYKQDSNPKYHAPIVAGMLARLSKARLIMGSATPNVSELYTLQKKNVPILELEKRLQQTKDIEIVDSRAKDNFSKSKIISTKLIEAIHHNLTNQNQTMLFHNRRGSARLQLCSSCDWINSCQNCHIPMVFHADEYQLRCHTCGFKAKPELVCPLCSSGTLSLRGYGTKQIVSEVEKLFPDARVIRFDADNTTKESTLAHNFQDLKEGKFDIIVGTQMLAKGLDLPKLSLVGILQAESGLTMPDFRTSERTFQLLTQVIGRVGRGHSTGKVIIQSFAPEHPSINLASREDYQSFYQNELEERKLALNPPFRYQLRLTGKYGTEATAKRASSALIKEIKKDDLSSKLHIIGPSPAFKERVAGKYQYQVLVKSPSRDALTKVVEKHLPKNWTHDLDPLSLL